MFTFKKPIFLGIDFGMSHIKAVELTVNNGVISLTNYGEIAMDAQVMSETNTPLQNPEEKITPLLKALFQKMKPKTNLVYVAMPGFSGLITLIELPNMDKTEMEKAVRFEAQRYIPSPLNEVVLSWDIIPSQKLPVPEGIIKEDREAAPGVEDMSVEVLLVAALHKEVAKYEKHITESDLVMELLELETFSLVRALSFENSGTSLIIDMGLRSTNLILTENGSIKVNRNVSIGGHEITVTLADSLGVSHDRAETLKRSDKNVLTVKESVIAFPSLELVVGEAKRMIAAYGNRHSEAKVERIILSGGASKMVGLTDYFSAMLGIPAEIGDPWKSIVYDDALKGAVSKMGVAYSVALGLALAGVASHEQNK